MCTKEAMFLWALYLVPAIGTAILQYLVLKEDRREKITFKEFVKSFSIGEVFLGFVPFINTLLFSFFVLLALASCIIEVKDKIWRKIKEARNQ